MNKFFGLWQISVSWTNFLGYDKLLFHEQIVWVTPNFCFMNKFLGYNKWLFHEQIFWVTTNCCFMSKLFGLRQISVSWTNFLGYNKWLFHEQIFWVTTNFCFISVTTNCCFKSDIKIFMQLTFTLVPNIAVQCVLHIWARILVFLSLSQKNGWIIP